jgi:hypothetical protein
MSQTLAGMGVYLWSFLPGLNNQFLFRLFPKLLRRLQPKSTMEVAHVKWN